MVRRRNTLERKKKTVSVNPYLASRHAVDSVVALRPVSRYFFTSLILAVFAAMASVPGLWLLNEKWNIISTSWSIGGFFLNGRPITRNSLLWFSLCAAAIFLIAAISLATVGYVNRRRNRSVVQECSRIPYNENMPESTGNS